MTERERIIERARKIAALVNSPNPHEAAVARSKLLEIMTRYGITEAELRPGRQNETAGASTSSNHRAQRQPYVSFESVLQRLPMDMLVDVLGYIYRHGDEASYIKSVIAAALRRRMRGLEDDISGLILKRTLSGRARNDAINRRLASLRRQKTAWNKKLMDLMEAA